MGVVRDVTVDNLVTAVGNIDTSTLAQDSTLQDVVTAISNISGGNDPVTNTTVNTLGKDTTLQSIATAISGLGTTLGSSKANISGDNIANPSAFRSNIGLNVTSGSLTNPDSHVYYSELKRTANQVILYIEMYNFTNQTETIIGSIPEAFRPSHRIMFDCLVLSPNVDALRGYARGSITPAGNITYQNLGNYANGFASFTLTWFI